MIRVDEYCDKSSHAFPCLVGFVSYALSCIGWETYSVETKPLSTKKQAPRLVKLVRFLETEASCYWEQYKLYQAIWAELISALDHFQNSALGGICTCNLNTWVNQKNCCSVCLITGSIKIIRERGVQRAVQNSVFHPSKPFEKCSATRAFWKWWHSVP